MTKSTIKALRILDVEYGKELMAREFAEKMWPDSKGWRKVSKSGVRGQGMWLTAGSYLAKLRSKNLVTVFIPDYTPLFRISHEGKKALILIDQNNNNDN